jgi:hypothetical protein
MHLKTQALAVADVLDALKVQHTDLVTHEIGACASVPASITMR